ncbi:protein HAIKU1 [Ricinus communis]|uniref:LRX2, putative n=1 Tax=Ricinus communis TaxID=3988 RepID=B9RN55_RICCO|nr:protein HAIKU1 [Ricinus communis]XP_015572390.1 protein HAIKU1 [Ricinus communis]XP_015572391.1 protein HAIKU1 [Ricinus communis]XP_015572392.1 protein HAIKU1 [Ricinus communis]XP_015572393.1 protein HAIKU1 [Ricinus communis]XP_025012435.1 protein HAIKU1 [Ricinus communis]EEF47178.1 LRX2, putative [Ricinus communis]|eukprot:XP_002515194.1 protein HAIKU1 [Ricinus communis]
MDNSKNRQQNDPLGVNKLGKNIRKSPLHQPNFANNANNANRQQPQPQVYNISKNDFRNIVQQLTGSPSQEPLPRPPQNPPKPQSMRLQKIRPPPLTPINRPHIPPPVPAPAVAPPPPVPFNNNFARPGQFGHPSPTMMPPMAPGDSAWANTAESPISAYMRYLQNSIMDPSPRGNQAQPSLQQLQAQGPAYIHPQPPSSGLLPNPHMPALPSPRLNGPVPHVTNLPSPQMNGPALLPSPTSQFLLPSPTGYMNLLSPRSPYPFYSPGVQFPPPLAHNFTFSPMAQSGILGPGPQPPPSPGLVFPLSPTGFFPLSSPRWRDQ